MHQLLDSPKEDVLAVRFTGQVDKTSYDELIPVFEERIRKHGKISVFMEMELFEGWSPMALVQEIKFDIKHARDLDRVALVGDQQWLGMAATAAKPFTSAEVRHYPLLHREEAWQWVNRLPETGYQAVRG